MRDHVKSGVLADDGYSNDALNSYIEDERDTLYELESTFTGETIKLNIDSARSHRLSHDEISLKVDNDGDDGPAMEDGDTDTHKKLMWSGQSNVIVAVRVRPLNRVEKRTTG